MNQKLKFAGVAIASVLATALVGGIAVASMDKGLGPIGNADADNNGEITRAEWLQAAGKRFDATDKNKDGKIVVGEIPAPPRGGPDGPGAHHRPHDDRGERGGPDEQWGPGVSEDAPEPAAVGNAN